MDKNHPIVESKRHELELSRLLGNLGISSTMFLGSLKGIVGQTAEIHPLKQQGIVTQLTRIQELIGTTIAHIKRNENFPHKTA